MTDCWFRALPASPTPRLKLIPDYFRKKFEILSVDLFGLPVDTRKKRKYFISDLYEAEDLPQMHPKPALE